MRASCLRTSRGEQDARNKKDEFTQMGYTPEREPPALV